MFALVFTPIFISLTFVYLIWAKFFTEFGAQPTFSVTTLAISVYLTEFSLRKKKIQRLKNREHSVAYRVLTSVLISFLIITNLEELMGIFGVEFFLSQSSFGANIAKSVIAAILALFICKIEEESTKRKVSFCSKTGIILRENH